MSFLQTFGSSSTKTKVVQAIERQGRGAGKCYAENRRLSTRYEKSRQT